MRWLLWCFCLLVESYETINHWPLTSVPTLLELACQEEPGYSLTASAPVSDVSAPVCTNGVWPPLRPVSVAQKNKSSTMLSSNVQSIDLLMDCTAWRFWTMRQSNGCSTSTPRSSAAKQWTERTGSNDDDFAQLFYEFFDLRRYQSFITAKCDGGRSCCKAKSFVKPLLRNYLCFDNFLQPKPLLRNYLCFYKFLQPINKPSKPYIRRFVSRLVTQGCRSSPKTLNVSICLTSLCIKAAECFNFGIFSETSTELSKLCPSARSKILVIDISGLFSVLQLVRG